MSGATATPDPHCASAEMLTVLNSLFPGHRLVDGAFPHLALSWRHGGGIALNLGGLDEAEEAFYERFRQQGGHAPVLGAQTLQAYLRGVDAAAAPPATTVFAGPAASIRALLDAVALAGLEDDVVVLQDAQEAPRELAAAGFPAGLKLTFRRPSRSQSWVLATRKGLHGDAFQAVMQALREIAVDINGGADWRGWRDLRIDLPEEGYAPEKAEIPPWRFIHDGARRSEGDGAYSWIWTGAERRVRILLGAVPSHFRRLRMIVPNARPASNLHEARVFLNGELVASRAEIWGEGSGAIDVDLAPDGRERVVTLAAPEADGDLSICIDKIELSA